MKLQLLVPHYDEEQSVIKPLLDSILLQQSISFDDIGIIICHDGEDIPFFSFQEQEYPFEIIQTCIPHKGVSAARNGALDAATADYVMFCDIDDMFFNMYGLWIIFNEINHSSFDCFFSSFTEETRAFEDLPEWQDANGNIVRTKQTGDTIYVIRENDHTFVHGKIYRKEFLLENNIRWNENLTIHEDSYFNTLCQTLAKNIIQCSTSFYLWKWRDNSVCRRDPKYILKTYKNLLDSNDALVEELIQRGYKENAVNFVISSIFDAYYLMNKPEWIQQENKEYRDSTEVYFAQYFQKRREIWNSVSDKEKMQTSNAIRARNINEGMLMEAITINDWLAHIETLIEKNQ